MKLQAPFCQQSSSVQVPPTDVPIPWNNSEVAIELAAADVALAAGDVVAGAERTDVDSAVVEVVAEAGAIEAELAPTSSEVLLVMIGVTKVVCVITKVTKSVCVDSIGWAAAGDDVDNAAAVITADKVEDKKSDSGLDSDIVPSEGVRSPQTCPCCPSIGGGPDKQRSAAETTSAMNERPANFILEAVKRRWAVRE